MTHAYGPSWLSDQDCQAEWELPDDRRPSTPTVRILMSSAYIQSGETAIVTFVFSDAPDDFGLGNVAFPSGTLSEPVPTADPLVYTAIFSPNPGIYDATNVIAVDTDWRTERGGVPLGLFASANYIVDTLPPTVTITSVQSGATPGAFVVTFTLSKASADFAVGDITVGNGAAGTFS